MPPSADTGSPGPEEPTTTGATGADSDPRDQAPVKDEPGASSKSAGGKTKPPRPEGSRSCPRCGSGDTKFCYYNNYNVKQPRFFCKTCQRYWTEGGTLRNVPPGSGRRKSKSAAAKEAEKNQQLAEQLAKQNLSLVGAAVHANAISSAYLNPMLTDPTSVLAFNAAQQQLLGTAALNSLSKVNGVGLAGQWGTGAAGALNALGAGGMLSSDLQGAATLGSMGNGHTTSGGGAGGAVSASTALDGSHGLEGEGGRAAKRSRTDGRTASGNTVGGAGVNGNGLGAENGPTSSGREGANGLDLPGASHGNGSPSNANLYATAAAMNGMNGSMAGWGGVPGADGQALMNAGMSTGVEGLMGGGLGMAGAGAMGMNQATQLALQQQMVYAQAVMQQQQQAAALMGLSNGAYHPYNALLTNSFAAYNPALAASLGYGATGQVGNPWASTQATLGNALMNPAAYQNAAAAGWGGAVTGMTGATGMPGTDLSALSMGAGSDMSTLLNMANGGVGSLVSGHSSATGLANGRAGGISPVEAGDSL